MSCACHDITAVSACSPDVAKGVQNTLDTQDSQLLTYVKVLSLYAVIDTGSNTSSCSEIIAGGQRVAAVCCRTISVAYSVTGFAVKHAPCAGSSHVDLCRLGVEVFCEFDDL